MARSCPLRTYTAMAREYCALASSSRRCACSTLPRPFRALPTSTWSPPCTAVNTVTASANALHAQENVRDRYGWGRDGQQCEGSMGAGGCDHFLQVTGMWTRGQKGNPTAAMHTRRGERAEGLGSCMGCDISQQWWTYASACGSMLCSLAATPRCTKARPKAGDAPEGASTRVASTSADQGQGSTHTHQHRRGRRESLV